MVAVSGRSGLSTPSLEHQAGAFLGVVAHRVGVAGASRRGTALGLARSRMSRCAVCAIHTWVHGHRTGR